MKRRDEIRIANCSGFFGDRLSAAREMEEGGPIDVLTGDYLAKLTMGILARQRAKDQGRGYAATFLTQLEDVLAACLGRGIRIVSNAGGLNPSGLEVAIGELAVRLGLDVTVATVSGDDLMDELADLRLPHSVTGQTFTERGVQPVTANAYLGGWGVAEALRRGADVVVTGRVSDASLVVGPAAWFHEWDRDDWDALSGAVVAGHVIEFGAQATGGNYSFFSEIPDLVAPGFPIAEVAADGSSIIQSIPVPGERCRWAPSLHSCSMRSAAPGTSTRTWWPGWTRCSSRMLERTWFGSTAPVASRRRQRPRLRQRRPPGSATPLRFSLQVWISKPRPLWRPILCSPGLVDGSRSHRVDVRLLRTDQADPANREAAFARLQVTVTDPDPSRVGRAFSNAAAELAPASYPGFTLTGPPGPEAPLVVYWPSTTPQRPSLVSVGMSTVVVEPTIGGVGEDIAGPPAGTVWIGSGEVIQAPIGRIVGARSGDKGGMRTSEYGQGTTRPFAGSSAGSLSAGSRS